MNRRRFRPTWWGTVLAVIGIVAGILLGQWQTDRARQKMVIADAMSQRAAAPAIPLGATPMAGVDLEYRKVEARGEFDPKGLVLLDNRVRKGRPGYEVVMPLRISGGDMHMLVNRGWIAGTGDRNRLPEVRTPTGEVTIVGIAVLPGNRMYELSSKAIEGRVWQNLTIERYVEHLRYRVQPVLVRQSNDTPDGLVRDWAVSDREINVHRSYAVQWYALAALVFVVYLVMSLKRDASHD